MESLGRILVAGGALLVVMGGLVLALSRIPGLRLGRLPGDVFVQREGFTFMFPLTTMLLVSGVISLVLWLIGAIRR